VKYRYANGIEILYKTERPYFRIEGEKGWIEVTFEGMKAEPEPLLTEQIGDDETRFSLRSEKEDFIDSIINNTETLEPAIVGHCVTSTCLLGHIAVRTGEKIRFDPKKQTMIDSPKSAEYLNKPITTSH
jgi:hypothetical protein